MNRRGGRYVSDDGCTNHWTVRRTTPVRGMFGCMTGWPICHNTSPVMGMPMIIWWRRYQFSLSPFCYLKATTALFQFAINDPLSGRSSIYWQWWYCAWLSVEDIFKRLWTAVATRNALTRLPVSEYSERFRNNPQSCPWPRRWPNQNIKRRSLPEMDNNGRLISESQQFQYVLMYFLPKARVYRMTRQIQAKSVMKYLGCH